MTVAQLRESLANQAQDAIISAIPHPSVKDDSKILNIVDFVRYLDHYIESPKNNMERHGERFAHELVRD